MKTFNNQTLNEKVIAIVDLPYLDYTDDKIKGFILKIACHNEEVDDDDVLSLEPNNSSIILIHVTLRESEDGDDFDSIYEEIVDICKHRSGEHAYKYTTILDILLPSHPSYAMHVEKSMIATMDEMEKIQRKLQEMSILRNDAIYNRKIFWLANGSGLNQYDVYSIIEAYQKDQSFPETFSDSDQQRFQHNFINPYLKTISE